MKTIFTIIFLINFSVGITQTWQILPSLPQANVRYEDLWFINDNTGWVVLAGEDAIYKTTNGGLNFTMQFSDPDGGYFRSVAFNNENLGWVGSLSGRLYRTTNGGNNWVRVDTLISPPPVGVCDISVVGDNIMYGSGKYSGPTNIIKTTDGGQTYENKDMGAYSNYQVGVWFLDENTGYIGTRSNIVTEGSVMLRTSDAGNTFSKVYKSLIQSEHIWNIYFVNSNIGYATIERYVSGNGAVIKTTNAGFNWLRIEIPASGTDLDPIGFINENTGWVANHGNTGLFQTENGGFNWTYINVGSRIHGIFVSSDSIAYASGNQVYKYTFNMVGINGDPVLNTIPVKNNLYENYPNPFNPSTTFEYDLVTNTNVVFEIYNSTGEFIELLVKERQQPGNYSVFWNAGSQPSGVYFYSLRTDLGNYYGKAVLIK